MKADLPPTGSRPETAPAALPYTDTKPQGAPDFYYAINATFRFLRNTQGLEGLRAYWTDLGRQYRKPVWEQWKRGGLTAIAAYWQAFWAAEPGGNVTVSQGPDRVTVEVRVCPAIRHIRAGKRVLDPAFCQQCYYVSDASAEQAGFAARLEGGNGACRQTFCRREKDLPPQDLTLIREAT